MFGDIVGFEAFSRNMESEKALELLNEILRSFDEAADRFGIERVRTTRSGYLASCGLSIPRVDNARRTVDFAIELQRILERFGGKHGTALNLRAGIDTGTVTSGLIGRSSLAYDMWGTTVDLANSMQSGSSQPGIYVTSRVHDAMSSTRDFTAADAVEIAGRSEPVWRLAE